MPADGKGPSYISSHSADVILSDIRPTKLKPDALRAINNLLDEFLYKILTISGSLATDKLRASLLGLLPTNLGKEALLEAEVELRAYWERTGSRVAEDDSRTFHLQWAFELLRLKCEAYSTLNEEDEDPNLEGRVSEKLGKAYPHPPRVALVDPAALYLTAILESICEHILSNVGRVVARDSSRALATVDDLFVALCEDVSIYGLFKTMKVYERIEIMSKGPQPRRSKSFTRNDPVPLPRTSSPQELSRANSSSGSRKSLERQPAAANPASGSASFEKSRAIRMFVNSNHKASNERGDSDSQLGHTRSESLRSETAFTEDDMPNIAEDAAILREFDDLMRSTSTMKVSLTPDRLRTMEVYKQEKGQRGRPPPHFSPSKQDIPFVSQPHTQKLPLQLVDSIVEDEEESPPTRARQGSVPSTSTFAAIIPGRIRSVSNTSILGIRSPILKPMRSSFTPVTHKIPGSEMRQTRDVRKPSDIVIPTRTRNRQRRHDSLDIDDVMNGSDDDGDQTSQKPSSPAAHRVSRAQYPVSAYTRDLMAILDEGPPEPKISQSGRELLDFLAQGPPDYDSNTATLEPSKAKGRLQRMISKLSMGGEKTKTGPGSDTSKPPSLKQPTTPIRSTISSQPSLTTLSSLANRPIPPRPPRISPPPSPHFSYDEDKSIRSPPQNSSQDTSSPVVERVVKPVPVPLASVPNTQDKLVHRNSSLHESVTVKPIPVPLATVSSNKATQERPVLRPLATQVNGNAKNGHSPKEVSPEAPQPIWPTRTISRKAVPSIVPIPVDPPPTSFFTETDAKDMQRLFTNASTVDECRLIFDMFMTRSSAVKRSAPEIDAPYPSPSPSLVQDAPVVQNCSVEEALLIESTLVEFFLGDTPALDVFPPEGNQPDVPIEAPLVEAQADVKLVADSQLPVTVEMQANVKPAVNSSSNIRASPISQPPPSTTL